MSRKTTTGAAGLEIDLDLHGRRQINGEEREQLLALLRAVDERWVAALRAVTIVRADGPSSLCYGEIVVAPSAQQGPCLDFESVMVVSEQVSVIELIERLGRAFMTGRFRCGHQEIEVSQVFSRWLLWRYPSGQDHSRWPCIVAEGEQHKSDDRLDRLVAEDQGKLIYYDDTDEVIENATTFPLFRHRDARRWTMSLVIEDHRARVADLVRDGDELKIHVEGLALDDLRIVGRTRTRNGHIGHFDLPARHEVCHPLPPEPVSVSLVILDPNRKEIDAKRDYRHAPSTAAVESDASMATRVERLLEDGETAHCEYKPWVELNLSSSGSKLREILATATAMANAVGGHILVGVNNHGVVIPIKGKAAGKALGSFFGRAHKDLNESLDDDADRRALELAAVKIYGRELCDEVQKHVFPSVELKRDVVEHRDGLVLSIQVYPGADPPYQVDMKEFYIRRNATNQRATREDLRPLYQPSRVR